MANHSLLLSSFHAEATRNITLSSNRKCRIDKKQQWNYLLQMFAKIKSIIEAKQKKKSKT